ncbi:MAG: amidase [Solirubrobacteraceae bacterium]|jgi:amidase|nr:amidase [Solirubrobacteraceae bacterium]
MPRNPAAAEAPGAELAKAPLNEQRRLLRDREISAVELTELHLQRIDAIDPAVNAFRSVHADRALADAADADRRLNAEDAPAICGLVVAVKDVFDVAGDVTAWGCELPPRPASRDAAVVARLRRAGAVIIGKTHLPELAAWPVTESITWGATRNPRDLTLSAGGSSGGSAAAVAAGLAGVALGTDGAGSIRIPAACCGLVGLKPGRPRQDGFRNWYGLSVDGPLARTVDDAALLAEAAGLIVGPPSPAQRPLRVAAVVDPPAPFTASIASTLAESLRRAVAALEAAGHRVEERHRVEVDWLGDWLSRYLLGVHDIAAAYPGLRPRERRTADLIAWGADISKSDARRRSRSELSSRLRESLPEVDVVLGPVVAGPPPGIGAFLKDGAGATLAEGQAWTPYTAIWNAAGLPAIAVPVRLPGRDLPGSVQLSAIRVDEAGLLGLAQELER